MVSQSKSVNLTEYIESFNMLLSLFYRCVVVFQGFYEWSKKEGKQKQPYYINFGEDSLMYMAGLFDVWKNGKNWF